MVQFATCTKYQFKYTGKTWVRECSTLYRFVFKITLGQKKRTQNVSMLDFCARDFKVLNRVSFFSLARKECYIKSYLKSAKYLHVHYKCLIMYLLGNIYMISIGFYPIWVCITTK